MLLDVFPIISDSAGRDARLPHQLKTDLPTKVIRDLPFLEGQAVAPCYTSEISA